MVVWFVIVCVFSCLFCLHWFFGLCVLLLYKRVVTFFWSLLFVVALLFVFCLLCWLLRGWLLEFRFYLLFAADFIDFDLRV